MFNSYIFAGGYFKLEATVGVPHGVTYWLEIESRL